MKNNKNYNFLLLI